MEWWKFNGYGFYIWGAYAMAALVVIVESTLLKARRAKALREAADCAADGSTERR